MQENLDLLTIIVIAIMAETGPNEVPDTFGVSHDAGNEHAGFGRVEETGRETHDVLLDLFAHVRNRALGRHAEDLG